MNNLRANDNRAAFQSKKHVSLDIKTSRVLERILRGGSSSEEEFEDNRKDFQSRKHQSLDSRVKFNDKKKANTGSSSDGEFDEEGKLIKEKIHDFSKPIVIDFKDLDISEEDEDDLDDYEQEEEDEDFTARRQEFQRQKAISVESRKR